MRKIASFVLFIAVVIGSFVILEPKVSSLVFAQTRETHWSNFTAELKRSESINGKMFWQFREFYSPGYFTFERNGIPSDVIATTSKQMNLQSNLFATGYPFLVYSSPYITSIESLVTEKSLDTLLQKSSIANSTVISKGNNYLFIEKDNTVWLFVLLSEQEMQKANGFFDYREKDKELTSGKYWFSVSTISLTN